MASDKKKEYGAQKRNVCDKSKFCTHNEMIPKKKLSRKRTRRFFTSYPHFSHVLSIYGMTYILQVA